MLSNLHQEQQERRRNQMEEEKSKVHVRVPTLKESTALSGTFGRTVRKKNNNRKSKVVRREATKRWNESKTEE